MILVDVHAKESNRILVLSFAFNSNNMFLKDIKVNKRLFLLKPPRTLHEILQMEIAVSYQRVCFNRLCVDWSPYKLISTQQIVKKISRDTVDPISRENYQILTISASCDMVINMGRPVYDLIKRRLPEFIFTDEFDQEIARRFIFVNSVLVDLNKLENDISYRYNFTKIIKDKSI